MNTRNLAASLMFLAVAITAHAQSYSIDWFTIDGGGGTSTGGVYSVSGTIGQPDAGAMNGGNFSVTGGFWSVVLVQSPDAPTLYATNAAPGFTTVWWAPASPDFLLQTSVSLSPPAWTNAPSGALNPVTVPATGPARFYRLKRE